MMYTSLPKDSLYPKLGNNLTLSNDHVNSSPLNSNDQYSSNSNKNTVKVDISLMDSTINTSSIIKSNGDNNTQSIIQKQQIDTNDKENDFENITSSIINESGGLLNYQQFPQYFALLENEKRINNRSILLSIIKKSSKGIQQMFIQKSGLTILNEYLLSNNNILSPIVLDVLLDLPIDPKILRENGKIGKTIKKLSKNSLSQKIKNISTILLNKWKNIIQTTNTGKKRLLENKDEPLRKKQKISTSNAFRARELVKKDTTIIKRNSNTSNIDNRNKIIRKNILSNPPQKNTKDSSSSTCFKPLRNSCDSLVVSNNQLTSNDGTLRHSSSDIIPSQSSKISKAPLKSCIANPSKKKKKKSISWASDKILVQVKYFPRDKTLLNNPNLKRIQERLKNPVTSTLNKQQIKQQIKQQPIIPQMKPSINWKTPIDILIPTSIKIGRGKNSTEVETQINRERTTLKVSYPDKRHIPLSPTLNDETFTISKDEDIPIIPLHDRTKPVVEQPKIFSPPLSSNTPSISPHQSIPSHQAMPPQTNNNIHKQDIYNALSSGRIGSDVVNNVMSNPNQQNLDLLRQLLTTHQPINQNYRQPQPIHPSYQYQQQQQVPRNQNYPPQPYYQQNMHQQPRQQQPFYPPNYQQYPPARRY